MNERKRPSGPPRFDHGVSTQAPESPAEPTPATPPVQINAVPEPPETAVMEPDDGAAAPSSWARPQDPSTESSQTSWPTPAQPSAGLGLATTPATWSAPRTPAAPAASWAPPIAAAGTSAIAPHGTDRVFSVGLSCYATAIAAWKLFGALALLLSGVILNDLGNNLTDFDDVFGTSAGQDVTNLSVGILLAGLTGILLLIGLVVGAVRQDRKLMVIFAAILTAVDALLFFVALAGALDHGEFEVVIGPLLIVAAQAAVLTWSLRQPA